MLLVSKKYLPLAIVLVVSIYSVFPVIKNINTSLVLGHEDLLLTWIMNQNIQKIPNDLINLFDGSIFYPYKNTIAYSDVFLPSSLLTYIPVKVTGNPLIALNLSLIIGQIATTLILYVWLKELTNDKYASVLGSTVFGLSQIRMHYFVHIHTFILQWFIASCFFIWKFRKEAKVQYLYAASIIAVIQFWESPLPVFWILAVGSVLLSSKFNQLKRLWKHLIVIATFTLIATYPLLNAYYSVSREFNYVRSVREAAHFSMSTNDLWGIFFSPGLYLLFIFSIIFIMVRRNMNTSKKILSELKWIISLALVGFIMALGPVLKWQGSTFKLLGKLFIPLPYGVFYYIIPGFKALRTPSRWIVLFALALSFLIAIVFSKYKSKYKNYILIMALIVAILGGKRIQAVVEMPTKAEYPKVYEWLNKQPGNAILELPIYTWGDAKKETREMLRMLYSLEHKKSLVNGHSGFNPPSWLELVSDINKNFPNAKLEKRLQYLGVDYIIVHDNEYDQSKLQKVEEWGRKNLVYKDIDVSVYILK